MNFTQFLKSNSKILNQSLKKILSKWVKDQSNLDPNLSALAKAFKKVNFGGKFIRGTLVLLGYQLTSKKENPEIYKIASSIEILHSSILAHDDIIDNSEIRRGMDSLYKSLGGDHYGISQAICLADSGFFLSFNLISNSNFDPTLKIEAIKLLSQIMIETSSGEMLDSLLPNIKKYNETASLNIAFLKTARYSLSSPLLLGALLAGANQEFLNSLSKIGDNLGIAFQLQDDLIGVFGDTVEIGKSTKSDILEGKATLLISHALRSATPEQKKILNKLYGNPNLSSQQIAEVKQIFLKTASIDFINTKKLEYETVADKLISKFKVSQEKRKILKTLAEYLIRREK